MKHLVSLLLAVLLCVCLSAQASEHAYEPVNANSSWHEYRCTICDDYLRYEWHFFKCTSESEVCICGATGYGVRISHGDYVYVDNGDGTHKQICQDCGEVVFTGIHARFCDETACQMCGTVDDSIEPTHYTGHAVYIDNHDGTHSAVCDECGELLEPRSHYGVCDQPACQGCGSTDYDPIRDGRHTNIQVVNNGDGTHSRKCLTCGNVEWTMAHWRNCSEPSCVCGEVEGCLDVRHSGSRTYADNHDGTHASICNRCNTAVGDPIQHERNCNESACKDCGSTDPTGNVTHYFMSLSYADLGNGKHSVSCDGCGSFLKEEVHYAYCNNATCRACGSADIDKAEHSLSWNDMGNGSCALICKYCGIISQRSPHKSLCDSPDLCRQCFASGVTANVYHAGLATCTDNGDGSHSIICSDCGSLVAVAYHSFPCGDADAQCECGVKLKDYPNGDIYHEEKYEILETDCHQIVCERCGYKGEIERHYIWCDNGQYSVCVACGSEMMDYSVRHLGSFYHDNRNGTHYESCNDCLLIFNIEPHWVYCYSELTDVCECCGLVGDISLIKHMIINGVCVMCGYSEGGDENVSVLPADTITIEAEAFLGTDLTYVVIPGKCKTIGARAFADSQLRKITIPVSVKSIADDAFAGCEDLVIIAPAGSYAADYAADHGIELK